MSARERERLGEPAERAGAPAELANALFEYLEIFHNRRRRHSSLGMLTPTNTNSASTPLSPSA